MTVQSYNVLRDICRAQLSSGIAVSLNKTENCFVRVFPADDNLFLGFPARALPRSLRRKCYTPRTVKLRFHYAKMISILESLEQEGYIQRLNSDFSMLVPTHIGDSIIQITARSGLEFLTRSVVVPIIVSLVTSFLYNLIIRYLETAG